MSDAAIAKPDKVLFWVHGEEGQHPVTEAMVTSLAQAKAEIAAGGTMILRAVKRVHDERLYRADQVESFGAWAESVLKVSRSTAYNWVRYAEAGALSDLGLGRYLAIEALPDKAAVAEAKQTGRLMLADGREATASDLKAMAAPEFQAEISDLKRQARENRQAADAAEKLRRSEAATYDRRIKDLEATLRSKTGIDPAEIAGLQQDLANAQAKLADTERALADAAENDRARKEAREVRFRHLDSLSHTRDKMVTAWAEFQRFDPRVLVGDQEAISESELLVAQLTGYIHATLRAQNVILGLDAGHGLEGLEVED